MTTHNYDDVFQSFHFWVKNNLQPGFAAPEAPSNWFLPVSRLRWYFEHNNCKRLKDLLNALFSDSRPGNAPNADDIMQENGYMLVFAILLSIEAGEYIQSFLSSDNLTDVKMPFTSQIPPKGWPESPTKPTLFTDFQKKQWMFCAAKMGQRKRRFDKEQILPFISREHSGSGGGADIYKVRIHFDYCNQELLKASSSKSEDPTFILKKYKYDFGEEQYINEVSAFKHVREGRGKLDDPFSLIKFYGSFDHDDSFYILLEYADGGNLRELLEQDEHKPSSPNEIMVFWNNIMEMMKALECIHSVRDIEREQDVDGKQIVQGWHQDVKPDNILVVRKPHLPLHQGYFKLADLGLCHFREFIGGRSTKQTEVGTETYGAPETYSKAWLKSATPRTVDPKIDIWSIGCVISEAAVWLKHGREGLRKFEEARCVETKHITHFKESEMFHDKEKALRCVKKQLEDLNKFIDVSGMRDPTTPEVMSMVKDKMLTPLDKRQSATQLYEHWRTVKERAQKDINSYDRGNSVQETHETFAFVGNRPTVNRTQNSGSSGVQANQEHILHRQSSNFPRKQIYAESSSFEPINCYDTDMNRQMQNRISGQHERPPPFWSVDQAKAWMEDHESKNVSSDSLAVYCHELKGRDHVILIDDSKSMRDYWNDVTVLVHILSYILLACQADDQIDLGLVVDPKNKTREKTADALRDFVRTHKPPGEPGNSRVTNLERPMSKLLKEYRHRANGSSVKRIMHKIRNHPGHRPMTLYVLTDGLYQDRSDIAGLISELITDIGDKFAQEKYFVGIQFIRFGHDQNGIEKLEVLDKLSQNDLRISRDIVDHEPANGNVWKMLLGPINPTFDNDPRCSVTAIGPERSPELFAHMSPVKSSHRREGASASTDTSDYYNTPQNSDP